MDAILSAIREVVKSPIAAFVVVCVTGFLIFAPDALKNGLNLDSTLEKNGVWIYSAFAAGIAVLIYNVGEYLASKARGAKRDRDRIRVMRDTLSKLTYDEKVILTPYITEKVRTRPLDVMNGNVSRLKGYGILYLGSSQGFRGSGWGTVPSAYFNVNISDDAYDYLTNNIHLLSLNEEEIAKEKQLEEERERKNWRGY